MPDFFSIIIPTFNRKDALVRCLDSLANQTFKNFEVIVCDDGSTDGSEDTVALYNNLLTIKYIRMENWGGPARPRNVGLKEAKGNWICFLDSDDWFSKNKMEYIINLKLDQIDFIYHDMSIINELNPIGRIKSRVLAGDAYHNLLFNLNAIPTSSVVIRKSLLEKAGGFSEKRELIAVEDFDLWIRIAAFDIRFKYIPLELGYYYQGIDHITAHDQKQIKRFDALFEPYISGAKNEAIRLKIIGAHDYLVGRIYLETKDYKKAIQFFKSSLKKGSSSIKLKSVYQLVRLLKKNKK